MTTTSIKLFALSMEMLDADTVNLEQDAGYGQVDTVQLHRSQVVLLAQQFGLIGQCDAGTVTRLRRHLALLNTKAEQLADWLLNVTGDRHQDLSTERAMAMALSDFASEFVADFSVDVGGTKVEPPIERSQAGGAEMEPPAGAVTVQDRTSQRGTKTEPRDKRPVAAHQSELLGETP